MSRRVLCVARERLLEKFGIQLRHTVVRLEAVALTSSADLGKYFILREYVIGSTLTFLNCKRKCTDATG